MGGDKHLKMLMSKVQSLQDRAAKVIIFKYMHGLIIWNFNLYVSQCKFYSFIKV